MNRLALTVFCLALLGCASDPPEQKPDPEVEKFFDNLKKLPSLDEQEFVEVVGGIPNKCFNGQDPAVIREMFDKININIVLAWQDGVYRIPPADSKLGVEPRSKPGNNLYLAVQNGKVIFATMHFEEKK